MTASLADGHQYPYLTTLDINRSEYLNIYNKANVRIKESDRYDITRSKWTDFTNYWRMLYAYLDPKQRF